MNQENIKNKIMSLIKNDELEIKSKWKFIARNYLKFLFMAILGIISIFIVSLLAIISRTPPELLMLIMAIFIGLYLLLVNEENISTIPRIYIWVLVVTAVVVVSFIINLLHMHERMMKDKHTLLLPMHGIYKHYKPESFLYEIKTKI